MPTSAAWNLWTGVDNLVNGLRRFNSLCWNSGAPGSHERRQCNRALDGRFDLRGKAFALESCAACLA
jgi:hypothetical protein